MSLRQEDLDKEMVSGGVVRHNESRAKYIHKQNETARPAVNRLLSGCIDLYAHSISRWAVRAKKIPGARHTAVKHIGKLKPNVVAFISAKTILNAVSTQKPYTRVCIKIGEAIEAEINFKKLEKHNPTYAERSKQRLMKTKVGYEFRKRCAFSTMKSVGLKVKYLTPTERLHIGSVCLGLFIESTNLVKIHKRWESPKRWVNIVIATDECMQWITRFEEAKAFLNPRKFPSLEVPLAWIKERSVGGYRDKQLEYSFIKTRNKESLDHIVKNTRDEVFNAVNNMQSTSWRVNRWIFEVMQSFWKNGIDDGKEVPMNKLLAIPSKPKPGATKEEIKAYSRQTAYAYSKNAQYRSQRLALAHTLYTAEKLLNEVGFYFPCQLDFRGRVYYVPDALTPQGSDYAKALLEFTKGVGIKMEQDFMPLVRYGFKLFGNKGDDNEALHWVKTNDHKIKKSVDEPWNSRWWQDAKEPWLFLRWCKEYNDAHTQPNFQSHLPITLDCTASGLQILALLTGDETSAEHVNLVQKEHPSDIYGKVLGELNILVREDQSDYGKFWASKALDRELTKPVCMTLPYGATLYGIRAGIEAWYRDKYKVVPKDMPDFWKGTMYLAKKAVEAVEKFLPKGKLCMQWITDVATPVAKANKPVCWTSPSGMLVVQPYMASSGLIVKTSLLGKLRYIMLQKENQKKVHLSKQRLSVAPNFIHSIDASILHLALCEFEGSVVGVHDCFGTHVTDLSDLAEKIKLAMLNIFKVDQLLNYKESISQLDTSISLPNSFNRGGFDTGQLLSANYLFV
jgi:DNA-directed RNA polymerase